MATNQDEKADGRLLKTSFDELFIVRSPLEINGLANVKNQDCGNRLKPSDTLAQTAPESTAEQLAQKPTSGSASSPTGSPKPSDIAAPSAGVSEVKADAALLASLKKSPRCKAFFKLTCGFIVISPAYTRATGTEIPAFVVAWYLGENEANSHASRMARAGYKFAGVGYDAK